MFNHHKVTRDWRGRELTLETGLMARQADGAVLAKLGGTAVLCTAVSSRSVAADQSFFPLTVMYQEKTFAAGKIPKGFFKREGRPSTKETLTSRLIDRPIRPLFHKEFKNETQVICTVLEHDMDNDPDVVALVGASAALTLSGVPFLGPIGGARVGIIDGEMVVNPGLEQRTNSDLDLLVAATRDGVLMVESEAKELSEKIMLEAVNLGFEASRDAVDAIIELAEHAAREPWETPKPLPERAQMEKLIAADGKKLFEKSYNIKDKQERTKSLDEARKTLAEKIAEKFVGEDSKQADVFKNLASQTIKGYESDLVRGWVLNDKRRIDGRDLKTVRQLDCRIGVLERTHGSALFTRGETQALAVTTLGTAQDEQLVDGLDGEYKERFMLHYNFPPFSVNEASPLRGPGRREIGHGKLAWRALNPLMPTAEEFPYTVRVVSEVLESNGSSSMATVCGASLALMNAGVPTTRPCAGIAMGLIKEGDKFAVLSDILGDEDHLGDMDFKVAGTEKGITALQMDIKITSITSAIMETALEQANANRMHILDAMSKAISRPQDEVSVYAPRIVTLQVPKDKIREVIGTGGKVIREICETTGAKIDIDDEGIISIASSSTDEIEHARKWIEGIVEEPEVGKVYRGKVMTITDFGAFVNFLGSRDGLVHISELADDRVNAVTDVISEGEEVYVYCHGIDDRGKVRLSMRMVDQETGKVRDDVEPPSSPSRRPSGGHGGRRDRDGGREGGREGGRRGGGGGGGRFERRPPRSPDRY